MYLSLQEISQDKINFHYAIQQPLSENLIISNRSVRFRDVNDTVLFFKDSAPTELELPQHKIQVPCDTITTSDACYQKNQSFIIYR
jgi:hypothetical protein